MDFVEETAFERPVEVALQISGRDHDAVHFLHLLLNDVLDGVFSLMD